MKKIIVSCFVLLSFSCLNAQTMQSGNNASSSDDKVLTVVQQKPIFPGDINKWLGDNVVYPQEAIKNNIQGTVFVSFIVEKDGSVSTATILRGANTILDNEALRAISSMPKWTPGMQNGHTVRVQYMVPVHFVLKDNTSPSTTK